MTDTSFKMVSIVEVAYGIIRGKSPEGGLCGQDSLIVPFEKSFHPCFFAIELLKFYLDTCFQLEIFLPDSLTTHLATTATFWLLEVSASDMCKLYSVFLKQGLSTGLVHLPDILQCLKTFLLLLLGVCVTWALSGKRPGILLNILQCRTALNSKESSDPKYQQS